MKGDGGLIRDAQTEPRLIRISPVTKPRWPSPNAERHPSILTPTRSRLPPVCSVNRWRGLIGRWGGGLPLSRSPIQKKIHLARAWASRNPVWCAWQVNYRCNSRCQFCRYWIDPMGDLPEWSSDQFRAGGRKLAELGALLISLAGGEPLLRPDIVDITEAVAEHHFPFITTNGWFSTPELAADLFAAGLWGVSVSIDYADATRHDRRRGTPGTWERAVRAIDHFASARRYAWQRVNWMAVLMDDNLDQIEPMIRLAAEHDAYFMVQLYGVRKTGATRFLHGGDGRVGEHLVELRRRHRNFLSNPYFLSRFDRALDGGVPGCRAGRGFFSIDPTGDIAVCVEERARPVANLMNHSAREIVQRLRNCHTPQKCQACWYNCRGEIESLYDPWGLVKSLPTLLLDRGRPPLGARPAAKGGVLITASAPGPVPSVALPAAVMAESAGPVPPPAPATGTDSEAAGSSVSAPR